MSLYDIKELDNKTVKRVIANMNVITSELPGVSFCYIYHYPDDGIILATDSRRVLFYKIEPIGDDLFESLRIKSPAKLVKYLGKGINLFCDNRSFNFNLVLNYENKYVAKDFEHDICYYSKLMKEKLFIPSETVKKFTQLKKMEFKKIYIGDKLSIPLAFVAGKHYEIGRAHV